MINLSKVIFSHNDKKRSIVLPDNFTPELAEDVGFHIGDGYMKNRVEKTGIHYEFAYSGNYPEDIDYFKNILIPRKHVLFNLTNLEIKKEKKNAIILKIRSKAIFLYYRDILKVKESPKTDIEIPKWVYSSLELQKSVFRGLIDSDGNFRIVKKGYPIIDLQVQSQHVVEGMGKILKTLEIPFSSFRIKQLDKRSGKICIKFRIQISGRKNVTKWISLVGFNNPKHIRKYDKWVEADSNRRSSPH